MNPKYYEAQKRYAAKNPEKVWAMQTIVRHRKNFTVKVTVQDLLEIAKNTKFCIYCGEKLIWERGKGKNTFGPSLDRKDNEKILTPQNVQVICCRCNSRKANIEHGYYAKKPY